VSPSSPTVICAITGSSDRLFTARSASWIAREQALDLPLEVRERFLPRRRPERLDAHAQRADGAHDARPAGGGATRQLRRGLVDPLRVVGEPVAAELHRVRPEGVGFEDLGAGAHVRFVHFLDQLRLLDAQLVVADVQEEAFRVQHSAHRPVEDVDVAVVQEIAEGYRHPGFLATCLTWPQYAANRHEHPLWPGI
jgi:hypothetical protein